ncbi:MAG: lipopolysaccharide transport periplasmic protein LptA [Deltaproteobacteria bacterium]|nr:lipopolysaccharide transport periplasmic protein LptA [Deltaproteobacteria bacterium]
MRLHNGSFALKASGRAAMAALMLAAGFSLAQAGEKNAAAKDRPKLPVTITSDSMEASKADGSVIFRGHVAAVEDFTLCADELAISYGKEKEIREMTATGNVRIFQTDRTATASKAAYDREKRTLVLTGQAVVKQCSDTVRGDRITVHVDDENALVEGETGSRVKAVIMPVKNCPEAGKAVSEKAGEGSGGEEARCNGPR